MATLTTITAPTVEPVTLTEAKAACRVTHGDDDDLIYGLIKTARQQAEDYCSLRFMTQVVEISMDRWPSLEIELGPWPIQSIDSVKYDDTGSPVTEQTLTVNTDYYSDIVTIGGRIRALSGWPSVAIKPNAIRIRLTVGYSSRALVPERIKEGIKAFVVGMYDNDSDMRSTAKQILWPSRRI